MSVILADYRVTIFGPRSADATEATVLTPIGGAAHSDSFQVTTEFGGAVGWKPYLKRPSGRTGRLDPLLHKTSIGEFQFEVQDTLVSSNTIRWVTAFVGSSKGRNRFKGLKVKIEERLTIDGSAGGWTDYFIGRIDRTDKRNPSQVGPAWRFYVVSDRKDESRNVFTGPPHDTVTYAYPCRLLPLGLQDRGDGRGWGGNVATPVARGTIDTYTVSGSGITYSRLSVDQGSYHQNLIRITEALAASLDRREIHPQSTSFPQQICPNVRCRLKRLDTSAEGDFWLSMVPHPKGDKGYDGSSLSPFYHDSKGRVTSFGLLPITSTSVRDHPFKYMAMPPDGTSCEWHLYHAGPPSKETPLFIDDVDPLTLWADLLDGKFSDLWQEDPTGSALPGDIKFRPIRYNSSAFSALAGKFQNVRGLIYDSADLNEWLERYVFRPIHVVAFLNGSGEVEPADIRIPSDPSALTSITNADYIQAADEGPEWKYGNDVITVVNVAWREIMQLPTVDFPTDQVPLQLPPYGWLRITDQAPISFLSELFADAPPRVENVDGSFLPAIYGGTLGLNWFSTEAERASREFLSFFGTGGTYLELPCRRTSNTDVRQGDYVKVTVTAQPDPASNQLGGTRVMLVLDRYERDDGTRFLELLDAGPDTVSVVPTLGTFVANSADAKHAVDLPVTVNALGDPVEIWVNVTATSVGVRPDEFDVGWVLAKVVFASATYTVAGLPPGMRVWARVRSRAVGKLPSAWAYPTSPAFIDTTTLTAPSSLATSVEGTSIVLTWTNGEARAGIMPYLDGSPVLLNPLKAGTTRFVFDELADSTLYTVGVRHEDEFGGVSALTTTTETTGVAATLDTPRRLQILQGRATGGPVSLPREQAIIGYGLKLRWRLSMLHVQTRLRWSQDVTFATGTTEIAYPEGVSVVNVEMPFDSTEVFVEVRFERTGYTPSAWSATVSAFPTALVAAEDVDMFPSGWAFLSLDADGFVWLNLGTDDPDTDRAFYEYVVGDTTTAFPTVDETDTEVLVADMPARILLGAGPILAGERYVVTVRFRGGTVWGASVFDEVSGTTGTGSGGGVAEVTSLLLTEPEGGVLNVAIDIINTKTWHSWEKLGGWPTFEGTSGGLLDPAFNRTINNPATLRSYQHAADTGTWYVIVLPYNANNQPGIRATASLAISGSPTGEGALTGLSAVYASGPDDILLSWNTNSAVDAGSRYEVEIYRDDVLQAAGRNARIDEDNSDPGSSGVGGWHDTGVSLCVGPPGSCTYRTLEYRVVLIDTLASFADKTYTTNVSGYFDV